MTQIRIHGRGGQGVVTAAELIAIAGFNDGKQAQAFPSFGVERTGAPIEAFVRLSNKPIKTREQVYEPDILIVLDASLLQSVDVTKGSKPSTKLIINTTKDKSKIKVNIDPANVFAVDATKIALDIIGKNIANTVTLGALAKATQIVSLDGLKAAIKQKFSDKGKDITTKNIKAITKAYKY